MEGQPTVPPGERRSPRGELLEAAFSRHAPRIFEYARRRGADVAEAEDVVSEVFVVLVRRLDEAPADPLPWLYSVARNVLANQVRSRRRKLALMRRAEQQARGRAQTYGPEAPGEQDLPFLMDALSGLSEFEREALLLVAWEGLTHEEAALSLGCSRDAFTQRLSRARRHLQSRIGDVWTDTEIGWNVARSEET